MSGEQPGTQPAGTLAGAVRAAAERWPDRVAWRFDPGETLTFADVDRLTTGYAQALSARGVRAGDRVALLLSNEAAFPLTWIALSLLGAAAVPLNIRYQTADAEHVLRQAHVSAIVHGAQFGPLLERLPAGPARARPGGPGHGARGLCRPGGPGRRFGASGPVRDGEHPVHLGHHRPPQGLRAAAPVLDPARREPGQRVSLPQRGRRDADRAAVQLHRPAVERRRRAAGRRGAGDPGRVPSVDVLGQGTRASGDVLLLPRRDAGAAAAHAAQPGGPPPSGPGGAVLGDPAHPARHAGGALGRALVRGLRDDRDRRRPARHRRRPRRAGRHRMPGRPGQLPEGADRRGRRPAGPGRAAPGRSRWPARA